MRWHDFDGKQVLQTKVADGINKPEELIQTILDKKAPTYHHSGAAAQEDSAEGESVGRQIYKHLMNGVSHMLPFVIGGGILIALAFLVDNQAINPANFGKNTPSIGFAIILDELMNALNRQNIQVETGSRNLLVYTQDTEKWAISLARTFRNKGKKY